MFGCKPAQALLPVSFAEVRMLGLAGLLAWPQRSLKQFCQPLSRKHHSCRALILTLASYIRGEGNPAGMLRAALRSRRAILQLAAQQQSLANNVSTNVLSVTGYQVQLKSVNGFHIVISLQSEADCDHLCPQAQATLPQLARGYAKQPPHSEIPQDSVRKP